MKNKFWLIIAASVMILIGLLRSIGGLLLLLKGNTIDTSTPIVATQAQIIIVAIGLLIIGFLLVYASINLLRKSSVGSWNFCWVVLLLFLLDGVLNGYLLFGQPLDQGQKINIVAVMLAGIFLIIGRKPLKAKK